jgi:hypothetical protein
MMMLGGVEVTTELLSLRWDKIFFTGMKSNDDDDTYGYSVCDVNDNDG